MITSRIRFGTVICIALLAITARASAQEVPVSQVSPAVQELRRHMLDTPVSTLTFQSMDRIFDVRRVGRTGPVDALPRADGTPTWQVPTAIHQARLFKISANFDF